MYIHPIPRSTRAMYNCSLVLNQRQQHLRLFELVQIRQSSYRSHGGSKSHGDRSRGACRTQLEVVALVAIPVHPCAGDSSLRGGSGPKQIAHMSRIEKHPRCPRRDSSRGRRRSDPGAQGQGCCTMEEAGLQLPDFEESDFYVEQEQVILLYSLWYVL